MAGQSANDGRGLMPDVPFGHEEDLMPDIMSLRPLEQDAPLPSGQQVRIVLSDDGDGGPSSLAGTAEPGGGADAAYEAAARTGSGRAAGPAREAAAEPEQEPEPEPEPEPLREPVRKPPQEPARASGREPGAGTLPAERPAAAAGEASGGLVDRTQVLLRSASAKLYSDPEGMGRSLQDVIDRHEPERASGDFLQRSVANAALSPFIAAHAIEIYAQAFTQLYSSATDEVRVALDRLLHAVALEMAAKEASGGGDTTKPGGRGRGTAH